MKVAKHVFIACIIGWINASYCAAANINTLADSYVDDLFLFYPELSTYYSRKKANNRDLKDLSPKGITAQYRREDTLHEQLMKIDAQALSGDDEITYYILKEELESSIQSRVCQSHLWSLNQMSGFHIELRYTAETQPADTKQNKQDTLRRWNKIPRYIKQDLANHKQGLELGYALPTVVVERVIEQLDALLKQPTEESYFYLPALNTKDVRFKDKLKKIIEKKIQPEISAYREYLQTHYLPKARAALSIASLPNGDQCYRALLRKATSLTNTPNEIFRWGTEAIHLREQKALKIGASVYNAKSIEGIKEAIRKDRSNYFKTREEVLNFAKEAVRRAKDQQTQLTNLMPQADVTIVSVPPEQEESGYSNYQPASNDGTRPAVYQQLTASPNTLHKGDVEWTAFHETYPGHHLQIAIQLELVDSHEATKYLSNSGFVEGWARYSESVADELNLYSSDKNRLVWLSFLPTGMVVDPGIHYQQWTREEAISYTMEKQSGYTRERAERYVDRIAAWPGQMATYGVGEVYFLRLRALAENQLGEQFDRKQFHDNCLKYGSVPLNFINQKILDWLTTFKEKIRSD